jgi:hypothetical protein
LELLKASSYGDKFFFTEKVLPHDYKKFGKTAFINSGTTSIFNNSIIHIPQPHVTDPSKYTNISKIKHLVLGLSSASTFLNIKLVAHHMYGHNLLILRVHHCSLLLLVLCSTSMAADVEALS